ncbi:MAG TPA: hypothetical protein DCZ76_00535 [Treponema sp.]|nr:hypothetical protein [Treponema sp.]
MFFFNTIIIIYTPIIINSLPYGFTDIHGRPFRKSKAVRKKKRTLLCGRSLLFTQKANTINRHYAFRIQRNPVKENENQ